MFCHLNNSPSIFCQFDKLLLMFVYHSIYPFLYFVTSLISLPLQWAADCVWHLHSLLLNNSFCHSTFIRNFNSTYCQSISCDKIFVMPDILRFQCFASRYYRSLVYGVLHNYRLWNFPPHILRLIFWDSIHCVSPFSYLVIDGIVPSSHLQVRVLTLARVRLFTASNV